MPPMSTARIVDPADGGVTDPPSPPPGHEQAGGRREQDSPRFVTGQKIFDRYLVVRPLGSGGMGEVWLVRHARLDCDRVLKFIHRGLIRNPVHAKWFMREAKATARVNHPGAVAIHDFGIAGDEPYIEMEYVEGVALNHLLRPGEAKPLAWVGSVVAQLCAVLEVAHSNRVVHRDLKPSNLMWADGKPAGRELKVLDFGIAKLLEPGADLTMMGQPVGTTGYASPEQIQGRPVDHRADLYSLGVLVFQLLAGSRPDATLPEASRTADWPWEEGRLARPVPAPIRDLIRECLATDPARRPGSAREFARRFAEALEPPSDRRQASGGGSRVAAVGAGIVSLAALVGGILWIPRDRATPSPKSDPAPTRLPAPDGARAPSPGPAPTTAPSPAPSPLGTGAVLAAILDDVREVDAPKRRGVRYLSWNHQIAAGVAEADVAAAARRLGATLTRLAGQEVPFESTRQGAGVFRLDIGRLGWDRPAYKAVEPAGAGAGAGADAGAEPRSLNAFDVLLLEYPYGWVEAGKRPRRDLEEEFLDPLAQVRPISHLRGDWLEAALSDPGLTADLLGSGDLTAGLSPAPEDPSPVTIETVAAELGYGGLAEFREELKKARPGSARERLEDVGRGSPLTRSEWARLFPAAVAELGLGTPIVPVDSLREGDYTATTGQPAVSVRVEPERYRPGTRERLVVEFTNNGAAPAHGEWYLYSGSDRQLLVQRTEDVGVNNLRPGGVRQSSAYETNGDASRDHLVAFISAVSFLDGVKYVGMGRRERLVHLDAPTHALSRRVLVIEPGP